jgi:hypothetical protein
MSMVEKLLDQLGKRGLAVEYRGADALALVGPAAERTPEVMATVRAFKADLLAHLRPRDLSLQRYDVHHAPPPDDEQAKHPGTHGEFTCRECAATVWDAEEAAGLCEVRVCPLKGGRHG